MYGDQSYLEIAVDGGIAVSSDLCAQKAGVLTVKTVAAKTDVQNR